MVRKYVVKCPYPTCDKSFSNVVRITAIESMKRHAKRKHSVDYTIEDVEYMVKEVKE